MHKKSRNIPPKEKEEAPFLSEKLRSAAARILSCGTYQEYPVAKSRRFMALNGILMAGILFIAGFSINALIIKNYILLAVNLAVVTVLLSVVLILCTTHKYGIATGITITLLSVYLLYLFISGGVGNTGFLWSYLFPFIAILLLGMKAGIVVIILYLALVVCYFTIELPPAFAEYALNIKYRFVGSFAAVSCIAFFFEYVNIKFETWLLEKNTALQELVEKLSVADKLLDASDDAIMSLVERSNENIVIIQDECVTFANTNIMRMGGYNREEILGKPFIDFVHPDKRKDLRANYLMRMSGVSLADTYNSVLLHRDGTNIEVEINGGKVVMKNGPVDLVFVRKI